MRLTRTLTIALVFAVIPAVALAATDNLGIDFLSGAPLDLYKKVLKVAWGFAFFAWFFALFLEFLKPPNVGHNYAAVLTRGFIILVMLMNYPLLAGTVLRTTQGIANAVSPSENAVSAFYRQRDEIERAATKDPRKTLTTTPGTSAEAADDTESSWGVVVAFRRSLFEVSLIIIFAVMSAAKFVVERTGALLTAVFYLLGPLALVASIPRVSATGANWFKHFVVYSSWPIFTGLVMNIVIHVAAPADGADSGYASALWTGLTIMVSMISVPMLASQVIGAAGGNFLSSAVGVASGYAAKGTQLVQTQLIRGVASVASAGSAAAPMAAAQVAQAATRSASAPVTSNSPRGQA